MQLPVPPLRALHPGAAGLRRALDLSHELLSAGGAPVVRRALAASHELVSAGTAPLRELGSLASPPSGARSVERYRALAADYDAATAAGDQYRRRAVERLALAPGDVVLDVGCGTGLNFAPTERAVGPSGAVVACDLSPEMLRAARERVSRHGWGNVRLIEAGAEEVDPGLLVDAALLCGTHDVVRSPAALANVLRHVRPGGRVVAGGAKWAPWWIPGAPALNLYTWRLNRDYVTTFEGFAQPWSHLAAALPGLEVEEVFFGGGYIAAGTVPPGAPHASAASAPT